MTLRSPADDSQRLSDLIAAIYDCVVDPSLWTAALDAMRDLLDCANATLYVANPRTGEHRMQMTVGLAPAWSAWLNNHEAELAALHATIPDFYTRPLDEPFVRHKDVADDVWFAHVHYREWAAPQHIVDIIDMILIRRDDRVASCALGRHQCAGLIDEREIALSRRIAPHLRRAVTITDLIDMRTFNYEALTGTLDAITVGIVLVAKDGGIVHANAAAERMFEAGQPLRSVQGRLRAGDGETTARLDRVIAMAAAGEPEAAGIGMSLAAGDSDIATAHVLPLTRGHLRTQLAPRAVAAVFVSDGAGSPLGSLDAIAEAYGLTRAEARLLGRLVLGESVDEAATALGIARTTVKTHVARLLAKTGSRRQTDLLALVNRLTPAVEAPSLRRPSSRPVTHSPADI